MTFQGREKVSALVNFITCCLLHCMISYHMNTARFFLAKDLSYLPVPLLWGAVAKEQLCLQCQLQPRVHTAAHKNGKKEEPKRGFATLF